MYLLEKKGGTYFGNTMRAIMSWIRSVVANFFVKMLCAFERGDNHLAKNAFFLFELSELVLEIVVFLLLIDYSHLQRAL